MGHERASFTKDNYVHVMPVEEIPGERLDAIAHGNLLRVLRAGLPPT